MARKTVEKAEPKAVERVQGEELTAEVFNSDMDYYITQFKEENNIEDFTRESQSRWNACLMYIHAHVFTDPKLLKSKDNYTESNCIMDSTFNSYNYDLLNDICNYYIYLCMINNKEVSINGFTFLTGINQETIHTWDRYSGERLSNKSFEIYQKLHVYREESLVAKLTSMNHPTAIAILLNKHYGYNLPGVSKEVSKKQTRTAAQIEQLYGDNARKELPTVPDDT
jgi:hypothetical protein